MGYVSLLSIGFVAFVVHSIKKTKGFIEFIILACVSRWDVLHSVLLISNS